MATASVTELWPPRHEMVPIEIVGVTDPAGAEFEQQIVGVSSDEPVSGPGSAHDPDAQIVGGARVLLRSERQGDGNGRVYEIRFSATNDHGSCMGSVQVSVPHDRSGEDATDDGQLYDPTRGD